MRVSCTFVFIAIFFVLQSQCAPINPTSDISVITAHLDGKLNSARIAPDALNGNLLSQKVAVGTSAHLLSHDKKVGLQTLDADHLLNSEVLAKRSNLLPLTGLADVEPATSSLDSIKNLSGGSPLNSIHQISSLKSVSGVTSSAPGLTSLKPAGTVPIISNVSSATNGLGGLPSNLLTKRGLPFAGSLPMVNNLALPGGASPLSGSLPALSNNRASGVLSRLPVAGGLPGMNSLSGLAGPVSGISGTSGLAGPVSGLSGPVSSLTGAGGLPGMNSLSGLAGPVPVSGLSGPVSSLTGPILGFGGPTPDFDSISSSQDFTPDFGDSDLTKRMLGGLGGGLLDGGRGNQITNPLPLVKKNPLIGTGIPSIGSLLTF